MHFYNYCTTEIDIESYGVHVFIQHYILRHLVQTKLSVFKRKQEKNRSSRNRVTVLYRPKESKRSSHTKRDLLLHRKFSQ